MFIKEREARRELEWLPRLLQRLPKNHPSLREIELVHYRMKAGFGGEKEIDRFLRRSHNNNMLVIGDLQLKTRSCQIDTIVLTPYFALILEVKNFAGTLIFNEDSYHMEQVNREGKLFGHNSPVTQAWLAREELLILFQKMGISLPVYASILLPYSTTLVEKAPVEIPVIYGYSLTWFISTLPVPANYYLHPS